MKNVLETKYEKINDKMILVEAIKENSEKEFYIAIKHKFQKEDENEYSPICKAKTKQDCLKKIVTECFQKYNNLSLEVSKFFERLSYNTSDNIDMANKFSVCDSKKECRFDNFIIEDGKAYFVNDWDDCDEYNKIHNPEFYEAYKNNNK